jgi:hypothetical protein
MRLRTWINSGATSAMELGSGLLLAVWFGSAFGLMYLTASLRVALISAFMVVIALVSACAIADYKGWEWRASSIQRHHGHAVRSATAPARTRSRGRPCRSPRATS